MLAFWYSLIFAILRTTLTIFVASSIHDFERKIITALRDVPAKAWTTEVRDLFYIISVNFNAVCAGQVQRFSEQLGNDMTALSGNGFFYVTRQLVLSVSGAKKVLITGTALKPLLIADGHDNNHL